MNFYFSRGNSPVKINYLTCGIFCNIFKVITVTKTSSRGPEREARDQAYRFAARLLSMGIRKGDRSPFIDQMMFYNNQNKYTTALLVPNKEALSRWAAGNNIKTTFTSLKRRTSIIR